ncbi:MAG TPA: sigma 54-interacting transcriptional regulator [Cyclobacteriaceae bacterium]|nr:sigma 54-interacting transcriptional regulator [Cyclobacteriaceae bacterium]
MLRPEQTLQLQLEVSETLTQHTTRDGIGLALAEVINKVVPFDFFLHSIWMPNATAGYRISSAKNSVGKFETYNNEELEKVKQVDFEGFVQSGLFISNPEHAGVYIGDELKVLSDRFPSFGTGYYNHGIRSIMILNMKHENGYNHAMIISARRDNAFTRSEFQTISTALPQIKMAFDNLFKYEKLKQEEEVRNLQLELNNVLLMHTSREEFGISLAEVINKTVSCERFILRMWTGPVQLGYRLPLQRQADGTFKRFSDLPMLEQAERSPESIIAGSIYAAEHPGIYQGDSVKHLAGQFPMFTVAANTFSMQSAMILSFKKDNTTCLLVLGNSASLSFREEQYQLMTLLLPQIILAFDNLFKYEKLMQEELERKTQLELMTAFNVLGDLEQLALDLIGKMNDFLPFDYWMQISSLPIGEDLFFRLASKESGAFQGIAGKQLFQQIKLEPVDIHEFRKENSGLFDQPALYVGEEMEALCASVPFFNACHRELRLNSLLIIPIVMMRTQDTILMMGSVRQYAFTQQDLEAIDRIAPYIAMAAQQYTNMFQIQNLTRQLQLEKNYLVEEIKSNYNFDEIVGTSKLLKEVFQQISQVAPTDSTVLILGETGTGKELIARAIHNQSPRKDKVLVKVNCASLPAQLIESELFGHERGSFTGALEKRIGKFELANGGTIFLDEIGELPLELQAKLLRVLQEREIERLGGRTTIPLDVRIIAATNRDLETEVAEGRFRSDLFYRLSVFPIHLPPLRERKEDIPMLISHFLQKYCRKMKKQFSNLKDTVLQEMIQYDWPGNIRELENVIEQSVIIGEQGMSKFKRATEMKRESPVAKAVQSNGSNKTEDDIIRVLRQTHGKILGPDGAAKILNLRPSEIEGYERKWILDALKKSNGKVRGEEGASSLTGINPTTLEARMKKLRITKAEIFKG